MESPDDGRQSAVFSLLGHKGDLLLVHFRRSFEELNQAQLDAGRQSAYGASSRHSGGVNTLMADGSVRFVKGSVAKETWWAIGTRANGEVISSDAY